MKLLESSSIFAIKNFVIGDMHEHRDGLTSRMLCGENYLMNSRDWARPFPASTKTEGKMRTTKLVSRKVESDQGGLMSYGTCHTLPLREFIPATACVYFIPSCFSLLFDVLHTVINSVYVQSCQQSKPHQL